MIRCLMIPCVVVMCLFLVVEGNGQDKKKKGANITGVITAVDADKDSKDTGTIKVKTPEKKKKDVVVAEAKEHSVKVTKETVIEKAAEKAKDPATKAEFADLKVDQNVTVTHVEGTASKILILAPKKK